MNRRAWLVSAVVMSFWVTLLPLPSNLGMVSEGQRAGGSILLSHISRARVGMQPSCLPWDWF